MFFSFFFSWESVPSLSEQPEEASASHSQDLQQILCTYSLQKHVLFLCISPSFPQLFFTFQKYLMFVTKRAKYVLLNVGCMQCIFLNTLDLAYSWINNCVCLQSLQYSQQWWGRGGRAPFFSHGSRKQMNFLNCWTMCWNSSGLGWGLWSEQSWGQAIQDNIMPVLCLYFNLRDVAAMVIQITINTADDQYRYKFMSWCTG